MINIVECGNFKNDKNHALRSQQMTIVIFNNY